LAFMEPAHEALKVTKTLALSSRSQEQMISVRDCQKKTLRLGHHLTRSRVKRVRQQHPRRVEAVLIGQP